MLTKNEENFLKAYEKPLLWPKRKFVVTYGLSWALIVILLTTGFEFLMNKDTAAFTPLKILVRIAIWFVGGLVYGIWIRSFLVKRYRKIKSKTMA